MRQGTTKEQPQEPRTGVRGQECSTGMGCPVSLSNSYSLTVLSKSKCRVAIDRFREMESGQVVKVAKDTTTSKLQEHCLCPRAERSDTSRNERKESCSNAATKKSKK